MSLRKQFSLVLLIVFTTLMLAMILVSVVGTRRYLEQQLASHAQDAATTLSVTLGQALGKDDLVLAQTNVASMFDRGYFKSIHVLGNDRHPIVKREMPETIQDVPPWFVALFPISSPTGEAFLGSGWRQLGKVLVVSQPTFAYQHLWRTTTSLTEWIAGLCALALALLQVILFFILKPLRAIEKAAMDVQAKRFEPIVYRPRAPELATVVTAMNQMSHRVGEMLNAETARAQALHKKAYQDELTGLLNRAGYELALSELLTGEEQFALGTVVSVELDNLRLLIRAHGFGEGERIIRSVTQNASAVFALLPSARLGRSNEFSFSFIAVDLSEAQATEIVTDLHKRIMADLSQIEHTSMLSVTMGAAFFNKTEVRAAVFARVDLALETARQSSRNGLVVLAAEAANSSTMGSYAWRTLIKTALLENRLRIVHQTVRSLGPDHAELQRESMARLVDSEGKMIPAANFIPMATRHRLMADVDRAAVALVLARLPQQADESCLVAINLSPQSIADQEFLSWFADQLSNLRGRAAMLAVEVPKFGVTNSLSTALQLRALVRKHGGKFGIDNFSLDADAMKLVRDIAPDYVKLTGSLIAELSKQEFVNELLKSFVALAHSLDIVVIAERVEHVSQVTPLAEIGVDAAQGYYFGAPTSTD
jgi:EAL domain-containing protein (putative c-di-GMP-specific phosphodiesterase class I)/GGDEF domain-containing protein